MWRNAIEHYNNTMRKKKLEKRKQMKIFKAGKALKPPKWFIARRSTSPSSKSTSSSWMSSTFSGSLGMRLSCITALLTPLLIQWKKRNKYFLLLNSVKAFQATIKQKGPTDDEEVLCLV